MPIDVDFLDDEADLSKLDRGDRASAAKPESNADTDKAEADAKALIDKAAESDEAAAKKAEEEAAAKKAEEEAAAKKAEEEAAAKKAEEGGARKEPETVPYARFREVIDQRNKFKERVEELESASPKPAKAEDPDKELLAKRDELYLKVEEARAEADAKTSAALQRQIDDINIELANSKARTVASEITDSALQDRLYDATLDRIEAAVPVMNPNSDKFSAKAVQAFEFHVNAYESAGMKPAAAAVYAAELLFGFGLEAKRQEPAKPAPKEEPKPQPKPADIEKAAETVRKQPPASGDRGPAADVSGIDINTLSEEDIAKLPDSKRAELRGDFA
jgi:hypothetical protein